MGHNTIAPAEIFKNMFSCKVQKQVTIILVKIILTTRKYISIRASTHNVVVRRIRLVEVFAMFLMLHTSENTSYMICGFRVVRNAQCHRASSAESFSMM